MLNFLQIFKTKKNQPHFGTPVAKDCDVLRNPASCSAKQNAWRNAAARCNNIDDISIEKILIFYFFQSHLP